MRTSTRSRQVAGAAAAALALVLSACGSDDSSGGPEKGSSPSKGSSSSESGSDSGSDSSAADGAEGASSATVDGQKVKTDGWRAICARSPNGKVGSAVLMEDISLEQLEADPEAEHGFISVHFDLDGDDASVTTVSITRPPEGKAGDAGGMVSFSDRPGSTGTATMTMSEEAVHIEGEGEQTSSEGERREGIPFTIDVACTDWQDLTNEGDVQQPGG